MSGHGRNRGVVWKYLLHEGKPDKDGFTYCGFGGCTQSFKACSGAFPTSKWADHVALKCCRATPEAQLDVAKHHQTDHVAKHHQTFTYVNLRLLNKCTKELGDFLSQAVEVELEDDAQPSSAALIIDNLYDDVTAAEGDCDVTID